MIKLQEEYHATFGSDIDRDGMYLEVMDSDNAMVAQVFYSDRNGSMTFTAYQRDISLEVVEWIIKRSKELLVPRS